MERLRLSAKKDVPKIVFDKFKERNQGYYDEKNVDVGAYDAFFTIKHPNGDVTYLAEQTGSYDTEGDTEEMTYFVDTRESEILGYGELRNNLTNRSEDYKDKPYVGYTRTEDAHARQGLGARRLLEMNAVSEMKYGLPLHSGIIIEPRITSLYEGLVKKGLVKKIFTGVEMFTFF